MKQNIYFSFDITNMPFVSMANHVRIEAPTNHFKRQPTEYILYFVKEGEMILQEGDIVYTLRRGDLLILDPTRCHFGHPLDSPVEYYYVHFVWEHIQELSQSSESYVNQLRHETLHQPLRYPEEAAKSLLLPKYFHIDKNQYQKMELMIQEIELALGGGTEFCEYMSGCRLLLLFMTARQSLANRLFKESDTGTQLTIRLINYLRQHYPEKITGDRLEEAFHMNFDYMNRRFKKETGQTIFKYLNHFRIMESLQYLKSGLFSQAQIALKTGFCNEYYYSKVFKKQTGVSPSEYMRADSVSD